MHTAARVGGRRRRLPQASPRVIIPSRREHQRSRLALLATSLRPEQWTKNLLLFAGLLFGGRLFEAGAVALACAAFAVFCALSGAMYLINDIADRESDRGHPLKQTRPVASGALPVGTAAVAAVAPVAGFVLPAVAGAVAVDILIGPWLLACTTLLALFLAFSKRRHELVLLGEEAAGLRRILEEYTPYLLDQMIAVVTASTVVAYAVFATSAETAHRLRSARLDITIPFVLYGIFRYLYLVHQKRGGGTPTATLLNDRPLLACVGLWGVTVVVLMYSPLGK